MCTSAESSTYDVTLARAREIGAEHGRNAASWVFDGNTSEATYRKIVAGLDSGDPEILDALPGPDLSGEWADGYSLRDLERDLGRDTEPADEWAADDAANAYEWAYRDAMQMEVYRIATRHLS